MRLFALLLLPLFLFAMPALASPDYTASDGDTAVLCTEGADAIIEALGAVDYAAARAEFVASVTPDAEDAIAEEHEAVALVMWRRDSLDTVPSWATCLANWRSTQPLRSTSTGSAASLRTYSGDERFVGAASTT